MVNLSVGSEAHENEHRSLYIIPFPTLNVCVRKKKYEQKLRQYCTNDVRNPRKFTADGSG